MSFLLNAYAFGDDNTLWIILAIGAILAIFFYVYRNRMSVNASSDEDVSSTNAANENADVTESNDEEIIAVIAAAIAMAESESEGLKFRVVSFKRI